MQPLSMYFVKLKAKKDKRRVCRKCVENLLFDKFIVIVCNMNVKFSPNAFK